MSKFTSEDCKTVIKHCVQCGVEFSCYASRNRKFCSPRCAYQNPERSNAVAEKLRKDRGTATCAGCGSEFQIVTGGGTKYCTQKCAAADIGRNSISKNRRKKAPAMVTKSCETCGKSFESWLSSHRRFCSGKCSGSNTDQIIKRVKSFRKNGWGRGNTYSKSVKQWVTLGGKKIYCRSLWESNYARYLQWQKDRGDILEWEHEPETFWFTGIKRGVMSYLPDFKVFLKDGSHEWHEVKGWMDKRSATKLKRMAKYHPSETVKVFGGDWFKSSGRTLAAIIPGWETRKKSNSK